MPSDVARAEDLSSVPVHHSADEILRHSGFPAARDGFVDAVLALYAHDPTIDRTLLEAGRATLLIIVICLWARYDEADPATWPTLRRVIDTTIVQGNSSARRLSALVSRFNDWGYLELRPVPGDRRIRIVTPTAKLMGHDQDWLVAHYRPLQDLFPEPGYSGIMRRDPAFQLAQRLAASNFLALAARIMADHPIVMQFLNREAGVMVLLRLIQLGGPNAAKERISYSDIGARFGVSRTHVRKMLQDAERQGLVALSKDGGQYAQLSNTLLDGFDSFLAAGMSGHDLIYQLALRQVGRKDALELS